MLCNDAVSLKAMHETLRKKREGIHVHSTNDSSTSAKRLDAPSSLTKHDRCSSCTAASDVASDFNRVFADANATASPCLIECSF